MKLAEFKQRMKNNEKFSVCYSVGHENKEIIYFINYKNKEISITENEYKELSNYIDEINE